MSGTHETITHTERVFDGRLVKLDVHTVTLPDGSTHQREVVDHPGAVAMVALDAGDVLLVRQYRPGTRGPIVELPAGTLEPGEAPELAAVRELQEEIGYRPGKLVSMGGVYVAPAYTSEYIYLYLATDLTPSHLDGDDDEFIEVVRLPLVDALRQVESGTLNDAKTITALLRVARHLGL